MTKKKWKINAFDLFNTIFMLIIVSIMLYPFLNTLAISLNNATDSIKGGIYLLPRIFTIDNYVQILNEELLPIAFINSILRTVLSTVGGLFLCSMAGYVLSRKEFIINKPLSIYIIMTMYISAGLIPQYFLMRNLGLIGTFSIYWVPGLFAAFNVIVIRTFMQGLPDGLTEAARIDGAGEFRTFIQIVMPICKPVLATVGLWMAVGSWNDWYTTFIYNSSRNELTVLQYELMRKLTASMEQMGQQQAGYYAQMAAGSDASFDNTSPVAIRSTITIIAALPILCVYPFLQKYFVKGVHVGSVKG